MVPKGATNLFPAFPIFLVTRLFPLPGFDSLTVLRHRGTKNTGYASLSPFYVLVTKQDHNNRLLLVWYIMNIRPNMTKTFMTLQECIVISS